MSPGSSGLIWDDFPIRFSFLWKTKTVELPLDGSLAFLFPKGCPSQTLMTADEYLRNVSFWLGDLPWGQRQDLLAEIRAHLAELPADTDLEARLGTPDEYAADLRAAAGLERRRGPIAFLRARRPRNLILAVLALTVIGLAIGTVVWVDSYQPHRNSGNTRLRAARLGMLRTPATARTVVFHKGRPVPVTASTI